MDDLDRELFGEDEPEVIEQAEEITQEIEPEPDESTGVEEASPPEAKEPDQPPEVKSQLDQDTYKAIREERQKRQALEAKLREIEENQTQEKPDFWEEPEKAVQSQLTKVVSTFENKLLDMSETFARRQYSDFDEVKDYFFNEMVVKNPALAAQAKNQPDPYDFVYREASKQKKLDEIGDFNDYEAKLREKITAELEAKYESKSNAKLEAEIEKRTKLPGTLSNARAAGGNTKPVWSGPPSDEELYD